MKIVCKSNTIDWDIEDGCPDDEVMDDLRYIIAEPEYETDVIRTLFSNLPTSHGDRPETVYPGDIARFILYNL